MPKPKIAFRKLRKYKYQLMKKSYTCTINIRKKSIKTDFVQLTSKGKLTIKKGYAWDGPSGPTIDTKTFMRASLVHDALYQLMRLKRLDYTTHRSQADDLLKRQCIQDGMCRFRAWYVHKFVSWFGERAACPPEKKRMELMLAP